MLKGTPKDDPIHDRTVRGNFGAEGGHREEAIKSTHIYLRKSDGKLFGMKETIQEVMGALRETYP